MADGMINDIAVVISEVSPDLAEVQGLAKVCVAELQRIIECLPRNARVFCLGKTSVSWIARGSYDLCAITCWFICGSCEIIFAYSCGWSSVINASYCLISWQKTILEVVPQKEWNAAIFPKFIKCRFKTLTKNQQSWQQFVSKLVFGDCFFFNTVDRFCCQYTCMFQNQLNPYNLLCNPTDFRKHWICISKWIINFKLTKCSWCKFTIPLINFFLQW